MLLPEDHISNIPIAYFSQKMTLFYLLDVIKNKHTKTKLIILSILRHKLGGKCGKNKFFFLS